VYYDVGVPRARTPDGVGTIRVGGVLYTVPWVNVLHVGFSAWESASAVDWGTFVFDFLAAYVDRLLPFLSDAVYVLYAEGTLYQADPNVQFDREGSTARGGITTDGESNNAAYVLSWRQARSYKGGKARTYLPGVVESNTDSHRELTPAAAADMQAAAANFITDVGSIAVATLTDPILGTVSYASGNVFRAVPVFEPYVGVAVHLRLGSQRRRLGAWTP
jgi:hypothetical protein